VTGQTCLPLVVRRGAANGRKTIMVVTQEVYTVRLNIDSPRSRPVVPADPGLRTLLVTNHYPAFGLS